MRYKFYEKHRFVLPKFSCGTKEKFRLFLLSVLPDGRTSAQKLKRRQQQRRQLYTSELAFRFSAKIYFFWFVGVTYLPFLSNLGPPLRSGVALSPGLARLHTIHRFQSCHFPNIHKLFPRPSPLHKVYRIIKLRKLGIFKFGFIGYVSNYRTKYSIYNIVIQNRKEQTYLRKAYLVPL